VKLAPATIKLAIPHTYLGGERNVLERTYLRMP